MPWGVESFTARPLIRLPVRVQRDAEHIGSIFPSSSSALRQGESIPALYAGLVPSHHTVISGGVLCLSGRRRRPKGWPPSAAQTQRAVFPHWAFTKAAYLAGVIDGINDIRFTRPISPYRIASGSSFHPAFRQRLRLCDHIRRTIHRSKRLNSLRTWALQ